MRSHQALQSARQSSLLIKPIAFTDRPAAGTNLGYIIKVIYGFHRATSI